jgi:uncharacterized membrane protein
MLLLIAGLILFFGLHSLAIVAPYWRERMLLFVGTGTWKGIYALLSGLGFILMLVGYAHARRAPVVLYVPPGGLRYLTFALMLPVFPLLLAAVKLWATAHLLAIGTLPDVLLFGSFLLWAIVDRISLKRRVTNRPVRASAWCLNDAIAIVLGLALYAGFLFRLHTLLIGVSPLTPP